ncbi:MAG: hypothetical protein R3305_10600 [Gammaproteobacteria bacterium]|nr:hypothetical protein [Gammaproteobacteria bacterium]
MTTNSLRGIVFAAALAAMSAGQAQPSTPASEFRVVCDSECLTQFAERYLDAVAHRQPSRVLLAPDVRFTENGAELAIGDSLWSTADGLGENRLIFTDPVSGGIQLYAAVVEAGLPSMLAARLKVEDREITEIETSVLRRNAGDPAMASFAVDRPIWRQAVPAAQRVSREALIDIADSYFEGITQARAGITPFDDRCVRFENGGQMTLSDSPSISEVQRMTCEEQFAAGMLIIVTSISNRRYEVVDEQNQIVSAIATFDHRGNLDAVPFGNPNNVTPAGQFSRPFSFLIFESWKVIDGKIRQIEATVFQVPYKMSPGWPAD